MSTTMYVAVFNKTFTSGILKSLTVEATCSYPDKRLAEKHINNIRNGGSDCLTGNTWTASDCRVLPLAKLPLAFRAKHDLVLP